MFDLRRLRVLRAVHHHGTVTGAAEALHLSPSAVSQQIRQLAKELGVALLEPDGRRVRLTSAAVVLLDHADALSTRWEQALADLAVHADGDAGPLRIAGFATGIAVLLAPAAALLRRSRPRLSVSVTQAETGECFDMLLAGSADLAVFVPDPTVVVAEDSRFDQRVLIEEPHDLLVPAGHPLAGRSSVALSEAAREDWVIPDDSCGHHRLVQVACASAGFTPRVAHVATEWSAATALVAHGLGVTLAPRMLPIATAHPIARVPLHGSATPVRSILTCVRAGSADHPAVAHGLAALREVAEAAAASPRQAAEPAVA
ncbi:LysR family transcriptional regulator [Streptomonospora nanhaiensis]|uniref:DNA-binding transcriptional LysR family regulator n=1 Tax=Streptomonospora nanhaiensis TaxID=1323731 RepID=A0A853BWR3_9ACTN|nr:LysR family transcriptional regulator [Streptomonospora nanhaiensis]MBV2365665.1 LysR family transcriptional regulator [Streptomonospora nanhaiensis]MBX9388119.1 LysR family transcriptional regulator [Streptomonospora nanhaiensis]NYI98897.1 DNA-binding transcriptional LysR family regulator [Streptomonospora nanhaiensis]